MSIPWGTGWPITASATYTSAQDIQLYDTLIKLWKGVRQRNRMLNNKYWPRQHFLFYEGRVSTVTVIDADTVKIADNSATWQTSPKRWVDWSNPTTGNTFEPANYDVVLNINADDPRDVIQLPIIDQPSATEITVSRHILDDYIAAKVISVYGDFGETEMAIVRPDGLNWAKRWPRRPNANEYIHSTVTDSTTTSLTDSSLRWMPDQYKNKELMCLIGGRLKRIPITGNKISTLTFTEQSAKIDLDEYAIIDPGKVWLPDNERYQPFAWYTGLMTTYGSHYPDDTIELTIAPATTVDLMEHDPDLGCVPVTHSGIQDTDVWTDFDNECDSDHAYSSNIFKSLRALQTTLLGLIPSFVNIDRWADGYTGTTVPNWTIAELFYSIGLGISGTASTGAAGILAVPFATPPREGIACYYTVLDTNGDLLASGIGTLDTATLHGADLSSACTGKTVYISYGFARYWEKGFRYSYDKTIFIADFEPIFDPDTGLFVRMQVYDPPAPKDPTGTPPDNFGIGAFDTRTKSTTTQGYDDEGLAADTSEAFIAGQYYRCYGDNWNDPGITPHLQPDFTNEENAGGFPVDFPYFDRFFRGKNGSYFLASENQKHGIITASNLYSITDDKQDWWVDWYGGGELRVESGTATGGSTTTLVDSSKINSAFWNSGSGRYVNFVLEIDKVEAGAVVGTFKVPITAMNASTGTLTFAAVTGLSVASGYTYRIREPKYELNRWKGRTLRVTKADGTTQDLTITFSDRHTLYFAPQTQVFLTNLKYQIIELQYGAVYKWDGSNMVLPTGADAVRVGVTSPQNFHVHPMENLPTIEKDYGLLMKGDVGWYELLTTLYKILNKLYKTKASVSWTSRAEPSVAENNDHFAGGFSTFASDWPTAKSNADFDWTSDSTPEESNGALPQASSTGVKNFDAPNTTPTDVEASLSRTYAYAVASGIPTLLQSSIKFFDYAVNPFAASGTGNDGHGGLYDYAFDSMGDAVTQNAWKQFDSQGASTNAQRESVRLGSPDEPTWCPEPPTPTTGDEPITVSNSARGYAVTTGVAILDWSADSTVFLD